MKRNLINKLLLLVAISITLYSCVHDEISSSSDPSSKQYNSKSVWKEDETYIKNVMQIYNKHEAEIKKGNGTPLWDYAMTMGYMDESFLIVPVASGKNIVSCIQVARNGEEIKFVYDNEAEHIKFFQGYTTSEKRKPLAQTKSQTSPVAKPILCAVTSVSMWYPESSSPGGGYWETQYITTCTHNHGGSGCNGYYDSQGNCMPSGYEPPVYPYPGGGGGGNPQPQEPQDPCAKLKAQNQNADFKAKVTSIDKPEILAYDHEMGYASAYPVNTTVTGTQYQPMENTLGSHSVSLPNGDQYFGFMHTHNNESNGGHPVKIFSPADLATFLTSCVANAEAHGSINDAYAMVVTSEGNYIIQYTGPTSGFGIGPNTIKFWKTWYDRETKAIQNEDGNIDQGKVEKMFLRFLKEKVNIDGIELYQTEKITGNIKKLNLNNNNLVIPTPCP